MSKEPRYKPGKSWSYSNTNYTLAQPLIEKVTGRSIAQEVQRRILRSLRMRHERGAQIGWPGSGVHPRIDDQSGH
ncbi:serine hydrolase domain-containing protein [Nonomuraea rubra]|uniref:serine hydrolase domain-containing protein n=1 Tax=Nonomuraea rubra TaxID=46180 RepID=UPI0033C2F7B9